MPPLVFLIFFVFLVSSIVSSVPSHPTSSYAHSSIHRKLENGSATYYMFVNNRNQSTGGIVTEDNLSRYVNPCGDILPPPQIIKTVLLCESAEVKQHFGDMPALEKAMCSEYIKNPDKTNIILAPRINVLQVTEEKCTCEHQCLAKNLTLWKTPQCSCDPTRMPGENVLPCNFHSNNCTGWTMNGGFKPSGHKSANDGNISVLMAIADTRSPTKAQLLSPYYMHTSFMCAISFDYYIIGSMDATVKVMIETLSNDSEKSAPVVLTTLKNIYNRVTLHEVVVSIGHIREPSRIVIECHPGHNSSKCGIADLAYIECYEHYYTPSPCNDMTNPFLCRTPSHDFCLEDVVCDGIDDCPGGADELNCDAQRSHMRCSFDESNQCDGWTIEAHSSETSQPIAVPSLVRASINANGKMSIAGTQVNGWDHPHLTHAARDGGGSFLLYSSWYADLKSLPPGETSLISPLLPATAPTKRDQLFGRDMCTLRFRFCSVPITSAFTIDIQSVHKKATPTTIWHPGIHDLAEGVNLHQTQHDCEWRHHSVEIPQQELPFYIFLKSHYHKANLKSFVAIDDISLSPSCFYEGATTVMPPLITLSTCGMTGPSFVSSDGCIREALSQSRRPTWVAKQGRQTWTVGNTGEHLIKACGASGGGFHSVTGGKASCVTIRMNLQMGSTLNLIIGQRGQSPCEITTFNRTLEIGERRAFDYVCSGNISKNNVTAAFVPGSGGGGATEVQLDSYHVIVAGGGGGAYPEELRPAQPKGKLAPAGYGASFFPQNHTNCTGICDYATPTSLTSSTNCNKISIMEGLGGFGGGGASCGPGGGGGGGYNGGSFGVMSYGNHGSSWFNDSEAVMDSIISELIHDGEGILEFRFCSLDCSLESSCTFISLESAEMECRCRNFELRFISGKCARPPPTTTTEVPSNDIDGKGVAPFHEPHQKPMESSHLSWFLLLLFLLMAIVIGSLLYFCLRSNNFSFTKQWKRIGGWKLVESRMDSSQTFTGVRRTDELEHGRTLPLAAGNGHVPPLEEMVLRSMPSKELLKCVEQLEREQVEFGARMIKGRLDTTNACQIGRGAFGVVYKARMRKRDGTTVEAAVKVLNENLMHQEDAKRQFLMEAVLMSFSNVGDETINLLGVCFSGHPHLIVMEYMSGGNLLNFLRSSRPTIECPNPNNLKMKDLLLFVQDIAEGCCVIESLQYVHRDLAARNCLLTPRGDRMKVKIGDFGLAKELYCNSIYYGGGNKPSALPIKWMPPEAVEDLSFTSKTDAWSFGVLVWEIFSLGKVPYPTHSATEVLKMLHKEVRMDPPIGTPQPMYDLMMSCWQIDPNKRPTFSMILTIVKSMLQDENIVSMPFPGLMIPPTPLGPPSDTVFRRNSTDTVMNMDTPCTVCTVIDTPSDEKKEMNRFLRENPGQLYTREHNSSAISKGQNGVEMNGSTRLENAIYAAGGGQEQKLNPGDNPVYITSLDDQHSSDTDKLLPLVDEQFHRPETLELHQRNKSAQYISNDLS